MQSVQGNDSVQLSLTSSVIAVVPHMGTLPKLWEVLVGIEYT